MTVPGGDYYLRRERTPLAPVTLTPDRLAPSLDAAYRALAQEQGAEPGRWTAWKLGGTNHASRAAFGVDRGYYGAIDREEVLTGPVTAPGFAMAEYKGEVELALRIDAAGQGFDAWCVALEMPSSPMQDLVSLGVVALVSDRCAAGALLLGPAQSGPLPDTNARFAQRINGTIAGDSGQEALVSAPEALLQEFLALAHEHGAPLSPGQWVATGGITPCLPYRPGDRVEVLLDGAQVLDVTISTGEAPA